MRRPLIAIAAALALAAAGCGTVDTDDLENQLRDQLSEQAGVAAEEVSVECPDGQDIEEGGKFDCTLTAPNGDEVRVEVTMTSDDGDYTATVPQQQFDSEPDAAAPETETTP